MYSVLAIIFVAIFFDLDPTKSFPLRMGARAVASQLGKLIEANVKSVHMTGWVAGIADSMKANHNALSDYGVHMVRRLLETGTGIPEISWSQILPTCTAMVANQAQVFTQIIDYYLTDEGQGHLSDIRRYALADNAESDDKILHYAMEAIRLNGTFGSYRECTSHLTIDDGGREVIVKPGDKVFSSFVSAARDPTVFPSPNEVHLNRPMDSYIHYGEGPHTCLGADASKVALTAMLKTVGKLPNLRRATGPQGQLKKIPRPGGFYIYMTENQGSYFPFPTSESHPKTHRLPHCTIIPDLGAAMKISWDGELPPRRKVATSGAS